MLSRPALSAFLHRRDALSSEHVPSLAKLPFHKGEEHLEVAHPTTPAAAPRDRLSSFGHMQETKCFPLPEQGGTDQWTS